MVTLFLSTSGNTMTYSINNSGVVSITLTIPIQLVYNSANDYYQNNLLLRYLGMK